MQDAADLRARFEPRRKCQPVLPVLLHPYRERPQPALRKVQVISATAVSMQLGHLPDRSGPFLVGDDHAHHDVGMPADVLGHGLDHDVDAVGERIEVKGAGPGVVHEDNGTVPVCGRGDCRDVRYFEGMGPRSLGIDRHRLGPEHLGDAGPDRGIEIGHLDPEP